MTDQERIFEARIAVIERVLRATRRLEQCAPQSEQWYEALREYSAAHSQIHNPDLYQSYTFVTKRNSEPAIGRCAYCGGSVVDIDKGCQCRLAPQQRIHVRTAAQESALQAERKELCLAIRELLQWAASSSKSLDAGPYFDLLAKYDKEFEGQRNANSPSATEQTRT